MKSRAAAASLCLLAACGVSQRELPSARVLITVEGLRADRLAPATGVESEGAGLAALPALMETALFGAGVVTSSVDPLAALVSVHSALPVSEHGVESRSHVVRHRVPAPVELLAEAYARVGFDTTAAVVGFAQEERAHGLERGFARHRFGMAGPVQAIELISTELELAAGAEAPLFAWLHVSLDFEPSAASWRRSTKHHLTPFVDGDRVLGEALAAGDHRALEAHLGRRRGTPVWEALQHARYDARLLDLDKALQRLLNELDSYRQKEPGWLALIGVRGEALSELDLPPRHRFAPSRVHVPFLWRGPEVETARVGLPEGSGLVPAWAACRALWPESIPDVAGPPDLERLRQRWVEVHTAQPGVRALVGPSERWIRLASQAPSGTAHDGEVELTEPPPEVVLERLTPLLARASFDGGRVELRSLVEPGKPSAARADDGEHSLELFEADEPFRVELTADGGVREADVLVNRYGMLDQLDVLRVAGRNGADWPEEEIPWVDITRESGARIRVKVASSEPARLRVRALQVRAGRKARDWQARSRSVDPIEVSMHEALGEAIFEGPSLDVSFVLGKVPAMAITIGGRVVPAERIRLFGRRFAGTSCSFLWSPGLRAGASAEMATASLTLTVPEAPPAPALDFAHSVLSSAD